MTVTEIRQKYDEQLKRMCAEYCHWRSCADHNWCHACPLWEHREDLEELERMEDDGK